MNAIHEITAYFILTLLGLCVISAATVAATLADGLVSLPAALAAAALTFQALRRPAGRMVAAIGIA